MPKAYRFSRYVKASNTPKSRIIGASFGEPGTGKTSFWLGAPGPIVVQSLDMGLEGVVEPFTEQKDIYVAEYEWNPTDDQEDMQELAIQLRDKFIEDFIYAIANAKTVVWDKETDVYELFRYAEFGAPNDTPRDYPVLYQRYRRYINMVKPLEINFGVVQGMKTPWVQKTSGTGAAQLAKTKDRVRKGMDEIEGLVHVNIEHVRAKGEDGNSTFELHVGKTRGPGAREVQDHVFDNFTFTDFAMAVFPDTSEKDWE